MVQLMIVDDEIHVVDRFHSTVDWQSLGVEQVYKAYSGPEALSILEQFSIDIVMTDIRMPAMNGLQLIAEIRRRWPKTKCILLSGYSEFQYAKEALVHQTEDYLLKPVKEAELLSTIRRVIEKVHAEWEAVVSHQRLAKTLKENLPVLRGSLLDDLLLGRRMPEAELREKMDMLGFPAIPAESFELMMIRLEEFQDMSPTGLSLMEYAIGNIVEELFGEHYVNWQTKDTHDYLVFVMLPRMSNLSPDPAWFERTASLLQSTVRSYLNGQISVLVSGQGEFPDDIRELYDRSVSCFRQRIGSVKELFIRLDEPTGEQAEVPVLNSLYEPPTLIHLLEAARWQSAEEKLRAAFHEMEGKCADSPEHLLEAYFSIASSYSYIAHKNGRTLNALIGDDYSLMMQGTRFRSAKELKEWAFRGLERIREDADRETNHSRSSLIKQIQNFVEQNIHKDVSLQSISEHVFLHPVYVSKIYKLETGENLSDYMNRIRMEKAEYMLKKGTDKIYEIAAHLGYQRPHSFNHAFKKSFGMTPQEYRDQFL
ncbi:response regulator [Cohnella pontilimi]|uniref:Response regulator n=1 Tax=Cohnella pontilimi TaxID=2564100 RepID=A0A4V5LSR3_9BACL|nr:response regulator [Cohnella pontilimi]TJY44089.1 response regulator [Cohnella pontilimi]